jgi:hypothetical protein
LVKSTPVCSGNNNLKSGAALISLPSLPDRLLQLNWNSNEAMYINETSLNGLGLHISGFFIEGNA